MRLSAMALVLGLLMSACGSNDRRERPAAAIGASTAAETTGQRWLCQAGNEAGWDCYDPATAPPPAARQLRIERDAAARESQPTGSASRHPASKQARAAQLEAGTDSIAQNSEEAEPGSSEEDEAAAQPHDPRLSLLAYPEWVYVAQLVAARRQSTIDRLAERYADSGHRLFQVPDPDSELQLLLIGVFTNHEAAERAIKALEPPLQNQPWIRQIGPLQNALRQAAD